MQEQMICYTPKGIIKNNSLFLHPKRYKMNLSLSLFIKEKRKQLKLTQPELAERAGVGLRFIREMEQGKQTLRLDKVNQVLALFGSDSRQPPRPLPCGETDGKDAG